MNTTATITFPVDAEDKRKAKEEAEKQGISLNQLLSSFVKGLSNRTKKNDTMQIQIEVPSEYFKKAVAKARENREAGKGSPIFDNAEEHNKWLEKQGI